MTTQEQIRKQLSGAAPSSIGATRTLFTRRSWFPLILGALLLGLVGWLANRQIENAMRKQLTGELGTILNADLAALRTWIRQQEVDAELLSEAGPVLAASRELLASENGGDVALRKAKPQDELRAYLHPRLKNYGYREFFMISSSMRILASSADEGIGKVLDGYRAAFGRQVLGGRPAVSKPFRSVFALPDEKGQFRAGLPTIFIAAPIRSAGGQPIAILAIRVAESRFAEILQVAQSGESGETYAFDDKGLLLSESRFDDSLKRAGLLVDSPDVGSTLTLELRDPQVNMLAGERPTVNRADQPLTRMAAAAIAGADGVDVAGYRNYAGVPVVGAWTWLSEYGFGVATEMSVSEAYRPLSILRNVFGALFGLLVLSALGIFAFMMVVARQRRRMEKAEHTIKQLGQYTLEEKIGSGGMGSVYRARHAFLKRPTAVKMLNSEGLNQESYARFEREVQLTSRLIHPNTIAVYDFGRTPDGVFYYAMECLDGINLEDLVEKFGPLPEGRVIAILRQVCGSLAEAHELGLIHRDIKPANIILSFRAGIPDFVKVLDFGLVKAVDSAEETKLTQANVTVGTPQYLSPEAIEEPDTITASSDVYAIGAVGYFLLTGTVVFSGKTIMDVCMKHVRAVPDPPSRRLGRAVSPELEALLLRCLAKNPKDRPAGTLALQEELAKCQPLTPWTEADAKAWWATFKKPAGGGPASSNTDTGRAQQTLAGASGPAPALLQ
jgi:hypothetical protein